MSIFCINILMDPLSCLILLLLLLYFSKQITHVPKGVPGMYFKSAAKERERERLSKVQIWYFEGIIFTSETSTVLKASLFYCILLKRSELCFFEIHLEPWPCFIAWQFDFSYLHGVLLRFDIFYLMLDPCRNNTDLKII